MCASPSRLAPVPWLRAACVGFCWLPAQPAYRRAPEWPTLSHGCWGCPWSVADLLSPGRPQSPCSPDCPVLEHSNPSPCCSLGRLAVLSATACASIPPPLPPGLCGSACLPSCAAWLLSLTCWGHCALLLTWRPWRSLLRLCFLRGPGPHAVSLCVCLLHGCRAGAGVPPEGPFIPLGQVLSPWCPPPLHGTPHHGAEICHCCPRRVSSSAGRGSSEGELCAHLTPTPGSLAPQPVLGGQ